MSKSLAEINDRFRTSFHYITSPYEIIIQRFKGIPGKLVLTAGIDGLEPRDKVIIFHKLNAFDEFTEDNDPYGEHDFGSFQHNEEDIFWKIDYYDNNFEYGSPDRLDLTKTKRVLTLMLAHEY